MYYYITAKDIQNIHVYYNQWVRKSLMSFDC